MSESTLTNLDGIPQYTPADTHLYHAPMMRSTNGDNNSKSMYDSTIYAFFFVH
jgi:hypothetical protein